MAGFLIREDRESCPPRAPHPHPRQHRPDAKQKHRRLHVNDAPQRQPLRPRDDNRLPLQHHQPPDQKPQVKYPSNPENRKDSCANNGKSTKVVQPPVAQFEAFSVYENAVDDKENVPTSTAIKAQAKQKKKDVPSAVLKLHPQRISSPQKTNDDGNLSTPMSIGSNLSVNSASKIDIKVDDTKKSTAKTSRELFFHVSEYKDDIYKYMREIELKHCARHDYMRKQTDITHSMRAILVDWLVEVCEEYRLETETLYLAVSYIDRFLSYMAVIRAKLQLVGTTAMFIASKYEEIYPPDLKEFVYVTDETYTKQQVLRMEHLMLKVLSFDLSTPTPLSFISLFCISEGLSEKTRFLAMYISELSLLEAEPYLQFPSSIIAASALAISRHTLLCCHCSGRPQLISSNNENLSALGVCFQVAWTPGLKRVSRYELSDLEKCIRELTRTHASASKQDNQAIVEKYKSNKYDGVALIEPKAMYSNEMTKCNDTSLCVENKDTKSENSEKNGVIST